MAYISGLPEFAFSNFQFSQKEQAMLRWNFLWLAVVTVTLSGCGVAEDVEVVDLNKVLDAFIAVLDEGANEPAAGDAVAPEGVQPIEPGQQDADKQREFLAKFAARLNASQMTTSNIGVQMNPDGVIEGFTDPNADMTKDADEERLFTVEIDAERSRVIASDTYSHHRDHAYRPRLGGLFAGYMLGSMLGRQNSHFTSQGTKPDFANRTMSPKDYHQDAVKTARSSAKSRVGGSARTGNSSRGFNFGK